MKNPQRPLNITISNIQVNNHQIVISGKNLNSITELKINNNDSLTVLSIESKSENSIVANTLSNVMFAADKVMGLVLSNAEASAVFAINFSLCDSNLNGAGFDCSIHAQDFDVLSYDQLSGKWKPKSINGLTYKGAFDASAAAPTSGGLSSAGEYYIISIGGNGYTVGDWAVDNGMTMDKIDNSPSAVSTVFGRIGAVAAEEGDYSLDKLSDVTIAAPVNGNILKFNGTHWVPDSITYTELDPLVSAFAKTTLPTCGAGEVLKSNGTTLSCVSDVTGAGAFAGTANRAVVTNGSGALTVSSITDTILGYLSGVTSDIQTQLNSKASTSSIVDWSVHSGAGPYIYPTRIYGGAIQASKTLVTDVSGNIVTSAVTPVELSYLIGVTSNVQNQLDTLTGSGQWTKTGNDLGYAAGKVGVGTATPAATLDVTGDVKIGNSSVSCTTTNRGSIRYNTGTNVLEFCNGSAWALVQAQTCSDATPNTFSFVNEANANISTLTTSNIIQITGINCLVPVTISGQGTPQYQICSDSSCSSIIQSWTSSPSNIATGQYLQVRLATDNVGGSTFQATIIIGSGASAWNVSTTGSCSGSPAPGTVCADGTIYAGVSPDTAAAMYTTRCDSGQSWNGVACSGTSLIQNFNNGSGTFVSSGATNDTTGKANTNLLTGSSDSNAPYSAANFCQNLTAHGHSDWYLPSKLEITVINSNRDVIKNFIANYYWSSTEVTSTSSFAIHFSSGNTTNRFKNDLAYVRCARR